jgi:hypothetical protein
MLVRVICEAAENRRPPALPPYVGHPVPAATIAEGVPCAAIRPLPTMAATIRQNTATLRRL